MVRAAGQVHQCPECDKTFTRSEFVNRHVRTKHLGVRPYSCACGLSYGRSDLLLRHKKKCPRANESASPEAEPTSAGASGSNGRRRSSGGGADLNRVVTAVTVNSSSSSGEGSPESVNSGSSPDYIEAGPSSKKKKHRHGVDCESTLQKNKRDDIWLFGTGQDIIGSYRAETTEEPLDLSADASWDSASGRENGREKELAKQTIDPPKNMFMSFIDPAFLKTDEDITSPYYLEPSVFALAFICGKVVGNTLPSVGTLSKYVRKAATTFLPFMPIIHLPTLRTSDTPMFLAYSWAVAGAACEDDSTARTFANKSLVKKRDSVQKTFVERPHEAIDIRFTLLQTLLVYQFVGAFNCTDEFRLDAGSFVEQLIANLHELPVQEQVRNAPDYVELAMTGQMSVDQAWKAWIRLESMKRTVFLVLIASQHSASPPTLTLTDVDLPLPCHEDAWNASEAVDWLSKLSFRGSKPPTLSRALFGLGTDGTPQASWMLGSFACTVLAAALQCALKAGWQFNP